MSLRYPRTRAGDHVDELHGVRVPDPYRWLEDADAPETRAWIEEQNALTFGFLDGIPARAQLKKRLTELWDYEKYGLPFREGDRYFWFKNDGLQNQAVLWTAASLEAPARVLLDPNTLSPDGTVSLGGMAMSRDGRRVAYGISVSGSDWQEWRVRDVDRGEDLPDRLEWVKFSGASWTLSGEGFYYSRFDEPAAGALLTGQTYWHKLYYHRIGEPQSADRLVYERKDQKEWGFYGHVTEDGRWLIITVTEGTDPKNRVFTLDLARPDAAVVELLPDGDAAYRFVGNQGERLWFLTDLDAPRARLIAIDADRPARDQWIEVIPESADTLQDVSLVGGRFVATYLRDARSHVAVHDLEGTLLRALDLPGIGTATGFGGHADDPETFFAFTGFTMPTTIYRHDVAAGATTVFRAPSVKFDPSEYTVTQVFVTGKDGTRVPMFLSHKKGLALDRDEAGRAPAYLYGYGGFNISLTPAFDVGRLVWMELGGVLAVANLRGGGEYGEEWHLAGTRERKQNVFDDFIACAEWLVEHGYTARRRLAIGGGSNGGLLVGACMIQRPELFGAALPDVGVMDMLRFHKFTIGWAWVSDYGSPDEPEDFEVLLAYSPLHNLRPGTSYPATMITTADHDDRVVCAHSFKFASALQAAQAEGGPPVLIRIDTKAGHGAGKPTSKLIETIADRWAFLVAVLDIQI
jgi:prolyl oligopeptidase